MSAASLQFGKVAVLMGGRSAEREISFMSGQGVLAALRAQGFAFYDWDEACVRFVTAWDTREEDARALSRALAAL